MIEVNITLNKVKKERIRINNIEDLKAELTKEGYPIGGFDEIEIKEFIEKTFQIDNNIVNSIFLCLDDEFTYRADDARGFIDYIEKIVEFEEEHIKLYEKIANIKKLIIDRVEYEREPSAQDNVEHIIKAVESIKSKISRVESVEEKAKIDNLEKKIDKEYVYTKDINLLRRILGESKKCLSKEKENLNEQYNDKTMTKTIVMELPNKIDTVYIKAKKGSIEYHEFLVNNIPRMRRLIKNIDKYLVNVENEESTFKINQSQTIQDSINIAIAIFNNREFKAISGKNNIEGYCISPKVEEVAFECSKVNKLGQLGIGYKRVNDSEKKIFEEINKQIQEGTLRSEGDLVLYSKWEPCPSCHFVISQFCSKYPHIKVKVKYIKKYGE
ncbi:MAG: deaminase domain-containing protein [Clostridium sp.]